MAQTVQLKRSSVASKVPTTSDLALGEIAINTYDGRIFLKKDSGTPAIVTVVTAADTQTLSNKTIDSGVLTGSLTAGGSTGTLGQVLTTDGSSTYWSTVTGGLGGATNLTYSANTTTVTIASDTGSDAVILAANSTVAGVITADAQTIAGAKTFNSNITVTGTVNGRDIATDGTKLDGIESGATADMTASEILTAIKTVDGSASGLDADLLDGQDGSYYLDWTNVTNKPDPVITLGGDLSGSVTLTDLASGTLTATIQPNSVALGTDTTGDYVSGITNGTGVTVSGTAGEGWSPTISIGQDVATTANVQFNNLVLSGNLTVNGTTTTISANNLSITDNLIYLNEGSTVTNPDLGFTGNYNDGTYAHTGVFRDATDNRWKFFKGYTLEPGITIDTTHASFQLSDVQASTFYGALSGNATTATTLQTARTINGTSFDGSANITVTAANPNALTIGTGLSGTSYDGSSAVTIAIDNTVATLDGSQTFTNKTISSGIVTGTLTANGSVGTSGQVLTSNASGVYWSTIAGGGGATNLTLSANGSTVTVISDTGTDAIVLAANSTTAGVLTAEAQTIGGVKTFNANTVFESNIAITGTVTSGTWNAIVKSRIVSHADATSITIDADTTDLATMINTQAAGTFTINAPTGTLFDGQKLMFKIKSTNAQTFSWNAVFAGSVDAPLPTTSSGASKTDYLGFIYDSSVSKWHVIAKNFGY